MIDVYYTPEKFGLKIIGSVQWEAGWEFDMTVLWKHEASGVFLIGRDSGCSCPSPFQNQGLDVLTPIGSLGELRERLDRASDSKSQEYWDKEAADRWTDQKLTLIDKAREAGMW